MSVVSPVFGRLCRLEVVYIMSFLLWMALTTTFAFTRPKSVEKVEIGDFFGFTIVSTFFLCEVLYNSVL